MIPVTLHLKNFLSYGENVPALDFSEFDVACLSGDNGHGKSAILDALTWALWGEARKAISEKSAADGLLRIGTRDMQVEFTFDLEAERYRVLRKYQRKKHKRGTSSLEFQIFDPDSQIYRSLSEKTNRQTQEKINTTLRMTYETFINSAFILQGHVDEFTKRNPSQRKAILAEILDLSRYETLRTLAREHLRTAEKEQIRLAQHLATMQAELDHKSEYARALDDVHRTLIDLNTQIQTLETQRQELEEQRTELQGKQRQATEQQRQQKRLHQQSEQVEQRIRRHEDHIRENASLLEQETEILTCYQRYQTLLETNTAYEEKRRSHVQYIKRCAPLESAVQAARHTLEKTIGTWHAERAQAQNIVEDTQQFLNRAQDVEQGYQELCAARHQDEQLEIQRTRVAEVEQSMTRVEHAIVREKSRLEAELTAFQRQIQTMQALADQQQERDSHLKKARADLQALETLAQQFEENKEEGAACRTALDGLKERRKHCDQVAQELKEKVDLLKRSEQPQCPLCQSELNDQKKHDLTKHFQQDLDRIDRESRKLVQEIQAQEKRLKALRTHHKHLETQLKQLPEVRNQVVQAEHALHESLKAVEQLQTIQREADLLATTLQQQTYAPGLQQQFAELQHEKSALRYDPQAHQTLKQRLKGLQHFAGEYSKLEDTRIRYEKAAARLPEIDRQISQFHAQLETQDYARAEQEQLQQLFQQIHDLDYHADEHDHLRQELQQLQNAPGQKAQLDQAHKDAARLQQELNELHAQRQALNIQLEEITQTLADIDSLLAQLPALTQQLREKDDMLAALRTQRDRQLQQEGTYQSKLDHCLNIERQQQGEQQRKIAIDKDCQIYAQLVEVFGKDGGIQTYLIENAVPEIEEEANAILSRLTDNRTSIAIESLKTSQSGETRETLDIKISDELGTRSYEMYSGGEAFRVDFAIRVALSKLLATRAGTQLKTLVIDEGFGTQDARGLEQLVEAIKAISRDFEKILVITHLEALKEAFPVKIEVVKLPDIGSQYQIIH